MWKDVEGDSRCEVPLERAKGLSSSEEDMLAD